jgi:molecular chaperone GrpE
MGIPNAMADPGSQNTAPDEAETDRKTPDSEGTGPDLQQLEAELADTRDKLMRALAEQQNIRRQAQRERDEAVRYAGSPLISELIDSLDNLRRALESVPAGTGDAALDPLLAGVAATERNLLETLGRHGVQKIEPLGASFDPHRHHAMFRRPDPAIEGTVIEVLQPGYLLHDRLIRPAMVGVAGPADEPEDTAA